MIRFDRISRISCFLLIFFLIFSLSSLLLPQKATFAQIEELEKVAEEVEGIGDETDISVLIGRIVKTVLGLMGLVAVVLIIVGGFQWMTSGGSEEKIKKAKQMMGAALIGLVIVVLAYAIASFVIEQLTDIANPE